MKFKVLLLLMATHSFSAKANDFNFSLLRNTKITTIDAALSKAKKFDELKAVSYKMYQLVFRTLNDTCPAISEEEFTQQNKAICGDIAARTKAPAKESQYYEFYYEKRLFQMACVNIGIDDEETTIKKLQIFWNKYKTKFKCSSLDFEIPNGNLLKFALSQQMPDLIESLAQIWNLDINFIDPKDGLNVMDYILAEIEKIKKLPNNTAALKVYEEYKMRVIDSGGKPSKE